MAISPHRQSSQDAMRKGVHHKHASEDNSIDEAEKMNKEITKSKSGSHSVKKMILIPFNSSGLGCCTSAARCRVTRPMSWCPCDTCEDTCPSASAWGSLPQRTVISIIHVGDSNSFTPGRVEAALVLHLGTSPSIGGGLLLIHVHVVLSVYHQFLSPRRSLCLHVVFIDCMYVMRTGSQLLGCWCMMSVVMLSVRPSLPSPRRRVITWSRPGPEKEEYSDRDNNNHATVTLVPCRYDGLITTDLTDHRLTPQTDTSPCLYPGLVYYTTPLSG